MTLRKVLGEIDEIEKNKDKKVATPLAQFGLYTSDKIVLPSFADSLMTLDHAHDAELWGRFKLMQLRERGEWREKTLEKHSVHYNPLPAKEAEHYQSSFWSYSNCDQPPFHLNYFLRNDLFLSRIFIQNAKRMHLLDQFAGKKTINILDLGCGLACSLMGVMTYFGEARIKYLG